MLKVSVNAWKYDPVLVAQTVAQASWEIIKEDRMDAETCYPLFSAELVSAEALASSQQKFQILNSADYKVMRQLLPMTLPPHVPGEYGFESRHDIWYYLWIGIFSLARDEEIEPDNLCPMKTPKVIEEPFLRTMKQVWIWNTTGRTSLVRELNEATCP